MRGRKGLKNIFKRDKKLRWGLSKKQRHHALKTLAKYQSGKGITVRDGPGVTTELEMASREWRTNTKDPISKADSKLIKKRLKRYSRNLQQDTKHDRASRSYFDYHTENRDKKSSRSKSSKPYRGDPDDRPSVRYREPSPTMNYQSDYDNAADVSPYADRDFNMDYDRQHDDFDPGRFGSGFRDAA